jgi:dihydropteroate synthase
LNHLKDLDLFGLPVLAGISRKSMIYKLLGTSPEEALNGTSILNTIALQKGASILRVHDVRAAAECITLVEKLQER